MVAASRICGCIAAAVSVQQALADTKMDCDGAAICGVLVVETGKGSGNYKHPSPAVHGLWPQVSPYGNSKCVAPKDNTAPTTLSACYKSDDSDQHQLEFENHEWSAHGKCGGSADSDDFFGQICSLSEAPLKLMAGVADKTLDEVATALTDAGYTAFNTDPSNSQVELAVCAGSDGKWMFAKPSEFATKCGGSGPQPSPSPSPTPPSPTPTPPSPSPSTGSCVAGQHGPKCSADKDCTSFSNCLRCAGSGYCTDQPNAQLMV